ncbi:MAG: hypothetical protein ACQRW7_02975 [Caulobacterales bacterium]|uniref:hypothetical protein n=1 Tax=Glycocaulis sp. TaxID=1969725 RepID=UPI003FA0953B
MSDFEIGLSTSGGVVGGSADTGTWAGLLGSANFSPDANDAAFYAADRDEALGRMLRTISAGAITINSTTFAALLENETELAALAGDVRAMRVLASSPYAMEIMAADGDAMAVLADDSVAMAAILASAKARYAALYASDASIAAIAANAAAVTQVRAAGALRTKGEDGTNPVSWETGVTGGNLDPARKYLLIGISWNFTNDRDVVITTLRTGSARPASGGWLGNQAGGASLTANFNVFVPLQAPFTSALTLGTDNAALPVHMLFLDCTP